MYNSTRDKIYVGFLETEGLHVRHFVSIVCFLSEKCKNLAFTQPKNTSNWSGQDAIKDTHYLVANNSGYKEIEDCTLDEEELENCSLRIGISDLFPHHLTGESCVCLVITCETPNPSCKVQANVRPCPFFLLEVFFIFGHR